MLLRKTPTKVYLDPKDKSYLETQLKYVDKKLDYEIKKLKNNPWFIQKYGEEAFLEKLNELKEQRNKSLLFEDESGLWTYSGLAESLANNLNQDIAIDFEYPKTKLIPYDSAPIRVPRPYQLEAVEKLLEAKHAGVSLATGLGKSFIILLLLKELGLQAVIMAPSVSIADQLFQDYKKHFGSRYVGAYYDGKKQFNKLFTVGVAQSLTRIEEGSPAWKALSTAKVFIADESHQCPASTLAKVCFGLVKDAPYRFFFSGTQMRGDGLGLLLDGITGPIVYRMTVRDGVDQGWLAKPVFKVFEVESNKSFYSSDPNEMTRQHLYYNDAVNKAAAEFANKSVRLLGHPVVILIEEIEQFSHLIRYLNVEAAFAHGGVTKENKGKIPKMYHDSEPNKLVEKFNAGEIPVLIGTSCIATGTDIQGVKTLIYLQGGKSEVQVRQAIGRGTRLVPGKTECNVVDFLVGNVEVTERHALARVDIYNDIYGPAELIQI